MQNVLALDGLKKFGSTVDQMFSRVVKKWPDRVFVIADGIRLTYGDVDGMAHALGRAMVFAGVERGDRVALWMSNIWEWIVVQFAVTRIGAVLTPLNTRLRIEDLRHTLRDSGAKMLFTQAATKDFRYLEVLNDIGFNSGVLPDLKHVVVARPGMVLERRYIDWSSFIEDNECSDVELMPELNPDRVAYILYTSGTTSLPKGVMLSHRNLNNCFRFLFDFGDNEILFLTNPLFAVMGCHNAVLSIVLIGGTIVLQENFGAEEANRVIGSLGCTSMAGIFSAFMSIAQAKNYASENFRAMRLGFLSPRRPEHVDVLQALGLKKVACGYGMTETCGPVTYVSDISTANMSCDGLLLADSEMKILGEDGSPVPVGRPGAVFVRGPQVMLGYFNPSNEASSTIDEDGWLRTGDIGMLDSASRFTWIGRSSDIYRCNGFNVAPREIEVFLEAIAPVVEVAVVGVPDKDKGEVGAAFIVMAPNASFTLEELQGFCRGKVASYKVPDHLRVMVSLPKTASGKIRKTDLKALFERERYSSASD